MDTQVAASAEAWRLDRGPFIFSGVPPMCVGDVDLINDSDEKVKVKAISVVGDEVRALGSTGLSELRIGARLAPQQRTRTRAHFLIDPHTPPGAYSAELCCGSQRERIVVHVWEKPGVRIDPTPIRLRGAGGDVLKKIVVISNDGNVTETLPDVALVPFQEQRWTGRSMVTAVRETEANEGISEYLDRVVRELKGTLPRPARVTLRSEAFEFRPGKTREVELEIRLPAEFAKGRGYIGWGAFMSGQLIFKVECNGAINSTKRRPR